MIDIIIAVTILLIFAGSITVIVREKRKGAKCVGCPYSTGDNKSNCSCNH